MTNNHKKHSPTDNSSGNSSQRNRKVLWSKWHRKIGVLTLIPIMLWCFSGLIHPIMSRWVKVNIPNRSIEVLSLNQGDEFKIPIHSILDKHGINKLIDFNIVKVENTLFYQVILNDDKIRYFNTKNGNELINGDLLYAEYLAKYFMNMQESEVKQVSLIKNFTQEYRFINRLLPVYDISLVSEEGIHVYVHTKSSRIGTANDRYRIAFLWFFNSFHNWEILDFLGKAKIYIMSIMLILITISALSGLYIYAIRWNKGKLIKTKANNRRWHRQMGISLSLVTLTFATSGAFHLLHKNDPYRLEELIDSQETFINQLNNDPLSYLSKINHPISTISLAWINNKLFYRYTLSKSRNTKNIYISVNKGIILKEGEQKHALYLAKKFSRLTSIKETGIIKNFAGEYGFVNKRLPVRKVVFEHEDDLTYYIETRSKRVASIVNNQDRFEGFSFAFLHKYHTLDFVGKDFRDIVMCVAVLGMITVSIFGLVLYLKPRS